MAWEAAWQIVSYDLLPAVAETGQSYDFLVFDEAHALRNPLSKQSKAAAEVFKNSPGAMALGLSGTYIPNEAYQIWNPLRTFFPAASFLGRPSRTGDVSWSFKERFCKLEMRHGHPYFYGLREEKRAELQELIEPYVSRVTQEEFAQYLPPLYVETLEVDAPSDALPKQWLDGLPDSVVHRGIFVHTREMVAKIAGKLGGTVIDGSLTPEQRAATLERLREKPTSLLVATIDSLSEGISLSYIKAALIFQWTTEMSTLLQFIGRFARADSTSETPTKVEIVVGPNDVERVAVLRERVAAANSILKAGRAENLLGSATHERRLSDDEFVTQAIQLADSMAASERRRGLIDADDGD